MSLIWECRICKADSLYKRGKYYYCSKHWGLGMTKYFTISEVARQIGMSVKTIMRWEESGKIKKSKRDWRMWRVYTQEDIDKISEIRYQITQGGK